MGKQTAKTTERSLSVINTIQNLGGATLRELETELEMARSTIHVHLQTLVEKGYIVREGEVYHIGLRFLNHGEYARARKKAYRLAKKTVAEIADQTNEEVEFVVKNNGRGILVHESFHPDSQFPSKESQISSAPTSAGIYYHLHSVATGKAILAELPHDQVEEIIDRWGLQRETDETITDKDEFYHELEEVRKQGVAYADEEYIDGLREVGRRVKNPDGSILGAIAIIGPRYRFANDRFTNRLPEILIENIDDLEDKIEQSYMDEHTS